MTAQSLRSIYQIKVTLQHIQPQVWRRFRVVSTTNLADLHIALQIIMGWSNSHLHQFVKGDCCYGIPDEEFPDNTLDEKNFRLDQLLKAEMDCLNYSYDFGDGWEHQVMLEKVLSFDQKTSSTHCLEGEWSCPPEDVGGPPGYVMFLEAISDASHPEHKEMLEWAGGEFDMEFFDLKVVNEALEKQFR
ncbi:MAG: plasmid pRiA4b ORF-3 family protein [Gammaproteobacteria bacterium]|nr:MAG: plasmid pRiA4b ORF-3 family protein [Gammaproteobacteria bacterium]